MTDNYRELKTLFHPLTAVLIPAGQSVVSAVAGGVTAASVAYMYHQPDFLAVGAVGGGVVFGVSWLVSLLWWRARVEHATETQSSVAEVVYPVETEVVRVELHNPVNGPYASVDFLDIPFDRDLLIRAAGHLHDRGWDTSNLGGANKPLTRSQAESLRDYLISEELAGWFREDRHTIGWYLTGEGRALLRRFYHAGICAGDLSLPPPRPEKTPGERFFEGMHTHTNAQTDLIDELWQR